MFCLFLGMFHIFGQYIHICVVILHRLSVIKGNFLPFCGITWVTESSMVVVVSECLLTVLCLMRTIISTII